jgi:CysZ protein
MTFNKLGIKIRRYNNSVVEGLTFFIKAHDFVWKNNFKWLLLVSGFSFLILFSFTIKLIIGGVEQSQPFVTQWLIFHGKGYLNIPVSQMKSGIDAGFWLLEKAIKANKDSIFTTLFLIIGTPYFSFISAKVAKLLGRKSSPFSFKQLWKEIKRGLKISIRNSVKQFFLILVITGFSFVPVVGIFAPLFTFIVQAYYNGILMTDYTLERNSYDVKESKLYYKQHKPLLFSIGLGFMFLLLIPVIGWFLAPTYALVASALFFLKNENRDAAEVLG